MSAALPVLRNTTAVAVGTALAGLGYASIVERNAFVVRELTMPVLTPGSSPLRVLHISDIHMRPTSDTSRPGCASSRGGSPTWSSTPATTWRTPRPCPPWCRRWAICCRVPGLFVFGSNDYFGPQPKNPANYLFTRGHRVTR